MVTAYSPILKLALPVQGELSGTWGDVVNDNITSMVEQAIAGRAVIDTWTTNSHTLTTANGTTSESRCAMLELTDTGTALTGAGEVICPTASKIYIVKNAAGQNITVKTAAGTGILVPNGRTTFLFCDGTNVVEAMTHTTSMQLGTSTVVTAVLDEDDLVSDSATALATQQSIKAYVDAQVTAQDLDFAGDSGTGAIDLDSQSLTIAGTANEIETAASGQTLTVGLPDAVTVTTSVTTPLVQATNVNANDGSSAIAIADSTGVVTVNSAVLTTADINAGTIDNTVIGASTAAAGSFTTVGATGNITSEGQVITDTINEQTATSGVTVDGVLLKDGGATFTADVSFGDNDKAIFGAGSDLQIYHDGDNSFIRDAGTGNLKIQGTQLQLQNAAGTLSYLAGVDGGATSIHYAGFTKLATTSTGIDVTGTVTTDGLTLANATYISQNDSASAVPRILGMNASNATYVGPIDAYAGGPMFYGVSPNVSGHIFYTGADDRLNIASNGDITFYDASGNASFVYDESAGSTFNEQGADRDFRVESDSNTSALFVDASTSRIGINSNAPAAPLHVAGVDGTSVRMITANADAAGNNFMDFYNSVGRMGYVGYASGSADIFYIWNEQSSNIITGTNNVEHMRFHPTDGTVFNEQSVDQDFRVEGDINTHALFVDAAANVVGIGLSTTTAQATTSATSLNVGGVLSVEGILNAHQTNKLVLERNGNVSAVRAYGATAGDGVFRIQVGGGGGSADSEVARFEASTVTFNETSLDTDFRVESDSDANCFFVNAGTSHIGMGQGTSPDSKLHIGQSSSGAIAIDSDINTSTAVPAWAAARRIGEIHAGANAGSGSDGGLLRLSAGGESSASQKAGIDMSGYNTTDGGPVVRLYAGSEKVTIRSNTTVFNDGSEDQDFRVESDGNSHALFVDGGSATASVSIGNTGNTWASTFDGVLQVGSRGVGFLANYDKSAANYQTIIGTGVRYDSGYKALYADAGYGYWNIGGAQTSLSLAPATTVGAAPVFRDVVTFYEDDRGTVFNEGGNDDDFRVESQSNANCFKVDAGADGGEGVVLFGMSAAASTTKGAYFSNAVGAGAGGFFHFVLVNGTSVSTEAAQYINRQSSDGRLIEFRQGDSYEGDIAVSGSTVSYNGFAGRHESSGIPTSTVKGTVVCTIDELDTYLAGPKQGQIRADHAKVKVSDVAGESCVYGVVDDFDDVGKVNVISVGIGAVLVTGACVKGDLLESNGDGTAKVQSDDIVRSKTIGKVTIGNSDTGVKLVSCVLYCG